MGRSLFKPKRPLLRTMHIRHAFYIDVRRDWCIEQAFNALNHRRYALLPTYIGAYIVQYGKQRNNYNTPLYGPGVRPMCFMR